MKLLGRVICEKKECIRENGFLFKKLGSEIKLTGLILGSLCQIELPAIKESLPAHKSISVICSRLAFRSYSIVRQRKFRKRTITGNKP